MTEATEDTYEDTIFPCAVESDGTWTTTRGHRIPVAGLVFDTPDGTGWSVEEVHGVTPAIDHIESCPSCNEWVGRLVPILEAQAHRIFPCCACNRFVWLPRPAFEDSFTEDYA